jgi:hypothetical protein
MSHIEFEFPETKPKEDTDRCPCCGRLQKIYKRSMNSNIAATLYYLYKHKAFDWVHVEKFLKDNGYPRSGDFHKATIWGLLIKKKGDREDGNPNNGFYKLTGRGIMFAEGSLTVKKIAKICNNTFLGFDGEDITIKEALGNSFNYNETVNQTL